MKGVELAFGEIEPPGMQDQLAGGHALGEPGEAHQVLHAVDHGGLLDGAQDLGARAAGHLAHHHVARLARHAGPGREIVEARVGTVGAIDQRGDAAAERVAQDDDMLDLEPTNGKLDRRRRAVLALVGGNLRRRHHGRDVAHGEDVAGLGLGQNARIDPGIGAADDQDLG